MLSALHVYDIARLSACLSDGCINHRNRLKLGLWNFHHTVAPPLLFLQDKFHTEILRGSPSGGVKQGRVGKISMFSIFKREYLENGSRYG